MLKLNSLVVSVTFIYAALMSNTHAEENLWIYTKGTDTRPQGSWELKYNHIARLGKDSGDYAFHDIRPEIEYGLTDRLTVGAELMLFHHDYSVDSADLEPMYSTQGGAGGRFNDTQFAGYELAMKYNFLSPYKDWIGLSVGVAYEYRDKYRLDGADIDQDSFVFTGFFQKNYLDSTLVFAINSKVEFERRKTGTLLEEEIALDVSGGVSYRFAPRWFIGLEIRHQSDYLNPQDSAEAGNPGFDSRGFEDGLQRSSFDFSDFRVGTQHQAGMYVGPTLHYAEKDWWVTGGALWQVKGHGNAPGEANDGGKNWDEHERVHLGFFLGYEF